MHLVFDRYLVSVQVKELFNYDPPDGYRVFMIRQLPDGSYEAMLEPE